MNRLAAIPALAAAIHMGGPIAQPVMIKLAKPLPVDSAKLAEFVAAIDIRAFEGLPDSWEISCTGQHVTLGMLRGHKPAHKNNKHMPMTPCHASGAISCRANRFSDNSLRSWAWSSQPHRT